MLHLQHIFFVTYSILALLKQCKGEKLHLSFNFTFCLLE